MRSISPRVASSLKAPDYKSSEDANLDCAVSFYGFSLDKGSTLADLWATNFKPTITPDLSCWNSSLDGGNSTIPLWNLNGIPAWQTDYAHPCSTIYDTLIEQAKQYLVTVSIASILGTACYTFAANRLHRRRFLTASFLLLMILFLITGGVVSNEEGKNTFLYCARRHILLGEEVFTKHRMHQALRVVHRPHR